MVEFIFRKLDKINICSILIFFALFIYYMEIIYIHLSQVSRSLNFYKCRRTDNTFNISISINKEHVEFFDKNKKLLSLEKNILSQGSKNTFSHFLNVYLKNRKFVNIRVIKNLLFINTDNDIAEEIYRVENYVDDITKLLNTKVMADFNHLDDSKISFFLYLATYNYLNRKIVLVYRNLILIYTSDGQFEYFFLDVGNFLNLVPSNKNEFLGCFSFLKDNVICMLNLKTCDCVYFTFSQYNKSLSKYLNSYKNKEIQKLVQTRKYLECSKLTYFDEFIKILDEGGKKNIADKYKEFEAILHKDKE